MFWEDDDREYSNGADGSCQECGAPTDEPWHAYCPPCYAREMGWERDDEDEEPTRVLSAMPLTEIIAVTEPCPGCGERRVLFPPISEGERRLCLDCRERDRGAA
jgi:hypothetical protein